MKAIIKFKDGKEEEIKGLIEVHFNFEGKGKIAFEQIQKGVPHGFIKVINDISEFEVFK